MHIIATQTIHGDADKFILCIVGLECHGILSNAVLYVYLIAIECALYRRDIQLKIVTIDMHVMSVDIVYLLGIRGIALLLHISLEISDHLLVDNIPSCTIILNISMDGNQHTRLLEERQEIYPCNITRQLHPVDLLLAVGIIDSSIVIRSADSMNHISNNIGTFIRQVPPKVQLPEGGKLHEVVIVTRSSGYLTKIVTFSITTSYNFRVRSYIVIVGTILQLPLYALTQSLLKVGLHTTTTHI